MSSKDRSRIIVLSTVMLLYFYSTLHAAQESWSLWGQDNSVVLQQKSWTVFRIQMGWLQTKWQQFCNQGGMWEEMRKENR